MLNEHLAQLWTNIHSIEHVSIRLYGSDPITLEETILIKNGLFMWFGIVAEKASVVLDESSFHSFRGRLLTQPAAILSRQEGFSSFLVMLDEVDDAITSIISSDSSQFKAAMLYEELHHILTEWSPSLWRCLSPLFKVILSNNLDQDSVRFLRQLSNLLSKIHIARPDLLADSFSEYLYSEELSFAETSVQSAGSVEYRDMISRIRGVLKPVIDHFNMDQPLTKHGPGAVSIPKVKSRVEKYQHMSYDSRIDYMLLHEPSKERMVDYSPFPLCEQDRTSRVVFVPKTWKKLRGISAEPVGLQYFQQAVMSGIQRAIRKSDLSCIINLHDQDTSRRLALNGSSNGRLATIDLSSASDSVTLRLVKDIFGNSNLCRWLLATRSTHTLLDTQCLEIFKFAPMGSACCFPVECLVFAAISLASAAKHFGSHSVNYRDFRVYGDDIICPARMAQGIMDDLTLMGFTVNSEKSYISGDYRESCGMDAWRGLDVTPLKLKDFSFDFNGSSPLSYEHHSRIVSYLNFLYYHGYKSLRSFFLKKFLKASIHAKRSKFRVEQSLLFGDGARGTIASVMPDNFHLKRKPIKGLYRSGFELLTWQPRYDKLSEQDESLANEVDYFEWLLSSRTRATDTVISYDLEYFRSLDSKESASIHSKPKMVPTLKIKDVEYPVASTR